MTDFLITEISLYPWLAWVLVVLAGAGLGYVAVWAYKVQAAGYAWLGYRRLVWRSKAAVRRRLVEGEGCVVCEMAEENIRGAGFGDDPPEYQHPDGDDPGYDWEGPGDDWSPTLAWGPPPEMPAREMAGLAEVLKRAHKMGLLDDDQLPDGPPAEPESMHEWHDHAPLGYHDEAVAGCPQCEARWEVPPAEAPEERCTNRDCDLFGFLHRPPCRLSPTMPAACYPAMGLKDGPAMPPQDWSGYAASLEVLARGDDDKPLHPAIQADLEAAGFRAHDTTEGLVDTSYTRAQAREVQAMITDGVIAPE